MGARDPGGGSIFTSGDYDVSLGGPLGTILAFALFLAVSVTMLVVVTALEGLLGAVLPSWLVLPGVLVVATVLVGLGLWGVLRFNEWRRYR